MTRWGKEVTPENAWQEYPRPQMRREAWENLNGFWEYAITSRNNKEKPVFEAKILVPFPIESALSGVQKSLHSDEILHYRRKFFYKESWDRKRILLHFGAVDWETKVYINENMAGEHTGGYVPFWFDITEFLIPGENELLVSVWDPTDRHWQQRGKQVSNPRTIWYTAVSGIWQTVWLEPVPQTYISRLMITPDVDAGSIRIKTFLAGTDPGEARVRYTVSCSGEKVNEVETAGSGGDVILPIPEPKLWSPDSPQLYDLAVTAEEDSVESYFGMRKFSLQSGRLCLNNTPLFQFGPLDQGYWPDGLYTPPSEKAMIGDLDLIKRLNCNMLRKHVKVEPASYYYHCDRIGLIVWQDMPNGGATVDEIGLFVMNKLGFRRNDHRYRQAGRQEEASRLDFQRELKEMVDHLYNFACIGMWVPFNEAWGQFNAKAIANWLKEYDPSRSVDHASGWFDQGGGDCESLHIYFRELRARKREKERATVLSEFGAYSHKVEGHLWNPGGEFGYKKFPTTGELTASYLRLIDLELKPWLEKGLSAAIFPQTTDVEEEVNGYITYDREVEKMDFSKICAAHRALLGNTDNGN
jgi:beta-galactosidase/beta-glucuronidase